MIVISTYYPPVVHVGFMNTTVLLVFSEVIVLYLGSHLIYREDPDFAEKVLERL